VWRENQEKVRLHLYTRDTFVTSQRGAVMKQHISFSEL
jgi:hypothetical protein